MEETPPEESSPSERDAEPSLNSGNEGPMDRSLPSSEGRRRFFSPQAPLWVFFFCREAKKLSGLLSWLDLWHSGLFSRALSPYVRGVKPFPDHFLFLPIETPAPNGILVIPHEKGKAEEKLALLPDTLMGLSAKQVVIDRTTLPDDLRSKIDPVTVLSTPDLEITVRLGEIADEPSTYSMS